MKLIQSLRLVTLSFPSLMLPPQEKDVYMQDFQTKSSCQKITGMIYQSSQSWCLWIGDEKYNQNHKRNDFFQIESVTNQEIKISFQTSLKSFSLHDSFDIKTGKLCDR